MSTTTNDDAIEALLAQEEAITGVTEEQDYVEEAFSNIEGPAISSTRELIMGPDVPRYRVIVTHPDGDEAVRIQINENVFWLNTGVPIDLPEPLFLQLRDRDAGLRDVDRKQRMMVQLMQRQQKAARTGQGLPHYSTLVGGR